MVTQPLLTTPPTIPLPLACQGREELGQDGILQSLDNGPLAIP